MIRTIESSLPTFKKLTFHEGLNILISDTQPDSTEKKTRNSAGKTSFIEIVHFIFGSNCDADSIFRHPDLVNHSFRATLVIRGEDYVVERSGLSPSKIFILVQPSDSDTFKLKKDKASERLYISNEAWKEFLGSAVFSLQEAADESSYSPGFRSMFSYFARREGSGAFLDEQRCFEKQQRWDWQVNLSYLFDLDWRIASEFQTVRGREGRLKEIKKAASDGQLGSMFGSVAELRPQLTLAEHKIAKLRRSLDNFEVLETYRELASRAARARTELQAAGREQIRLQETLYHLRASLQSEKPASQDELARVYADAGIELPGVALRRFDEVQAFHDSVTSNRQVHLRNEISETSSRLAATERRMGALSEERTSILQSLEGRGALEDFLTMQRELAEVEAGAAMLRQQFEAAELLEGQSTELIELRAALKRRLQIDHQERNAALGKAIVAVADVIGELYDDRDGRFVVEATSNGPEFDISIDGDRGGGISKMEIFCFDIVLLGLVSPRLGGPGFLIHDSHLFDGVDERQIATAISIGAREAERIGCQYIVTMNSDVLSKLPFVNGDFVNAAILEARLSDGDEHGGLFGFRFN